MDDRKQTNLIPAARQIDAIEERANYNILQEMADTVNLADQELVRAFQSGPSSAAMSEQEAVAAIEELERQQSPEQTPAGQGTLGFTPPQPSDFTNAQNALPPNDLQTLVSFGYPANNALQPGQVNGQDEAALRQELRKILDDID